MNTLFAQAFRLAITFLVPAVVWALLAAGLYQLVRSGIRRLHWPTRRAQELARGSLS